MTDSSDWPELLASFRSAKFNDLRPGQRRALDAYVAATATDIAVELPTGYGKTLLGLLIADHHLEQGQRVAFLTGNNHLTGQVFDEASELPGYDIVQFSGGNYPPGALARYNSAQALGVMNYWVYFNSSPKVEPADVVIFDDAHLAEQPIAGMFAIRIGADDQPRLYDAVCDLVLANSSLYPSVELMRDRAAGPTTAPELLAFSDLDTIAGPLITLLDEQLPPAERRFVLARLRPAIKACGLLVGPSAIELRPYTPPTRTLPQFEASSRRVYMSATLGTMDDLQRRLGVPAPTQLLLDDPVREEPVGERIFIINPGDDDALTDRPFDFVLEQADQAGRVAWLCASHDEADRVQRALTAVTRTSYRLRSGDDRSLADWADDPNGHLVTAGRFDGMDFSDDLCRLVVLPSLPAASTEFERFVMAYLGDATYMRHRIGQRVTQALGRANRTEDDWAMYLAAGPGFGTLLASSAVQAEIPAGVCAEVNRALDRVEGGWAAAEHDADGFWEQHDTTERPAPPGQAGSADISAEEDIPRRRRRPGRTSQAATSGSAANEVAAVTDMWLGDYAAAAGHAETAADTLARLGQVEHAAFWRYVAAQAEWADGANGRAIDLLRAAVTETQNTAWFVRLRKVLATLTRQQVNVGADQPWAGWDDWLRSAGPVRAVDAVNRMSGAWAGTHDQQAEALVLLGRLAGVDASRPVGNAVTDTVWAFIGRRGTCQRLWEVKTGDPDRVPRDWVDQNIGQVATARSASSRAQVSGCILTHLTEMEPEAAAAARDETTIVTVAAAETLTSTLAALFRDYAGRWGEGTVAERGSARDAVQSRLPDPNWVGRLLKPGRLVTRADVRDALRAGS